MRIGSNAASIRENLSKEDADLTLSEESQRIIYDMGNVELFELGKKPKTVQCRSCLKHVLEGIFL